MEQLAPAATFPVQLSVSAKLGAFVPPIAMLVMPSGVDALLVNVTGWDALVVPTTWSENDRLVAKQRPAHTPQRWTG